MSIPRPTEEMSQSAPPHDSAAERALLGGLLHDNSYITNVCTILGKHDLYDRRHAAIFDAIVNLYDSGAVADVVTVKDHLQKSGNLTEAGGSAYLAELLQDAYTAATSEYYAQIVKDKSILRALMHTSSLLWRRAANQEGEIAELLDEAEKRIFEIASHRTDKGFEPLKTLLLAVHYRLDRKDRAEGAIDGLHTGFMDLDVMTAGLHPGELVIVAGRPGMGKTAFALRMMEYLAVNEKLPCGLFSLEMSAEQIAQRLLCSYARVSSHRLRSGRLREDEYLMLANATGPLSESPIFVDDSPGLSMWELRTRARLLKRQYDVQLLVVDYLQLMTSGERMENRQQEISLISRSLKGLAKELEIPIIACSQLSRMVETRGGEKKPILADLRESGAIEQDADVVMFVYRPAAYKLSEEEREKIRNTDEENLAEIIIAKQRNGPTGTIKLTFVDEFIRFENRETFRAT